MFDLPVPGRFGSGERRFLAHLYARSLHTPTFPTLLELTEAKVTPSRGRARIFYHQLERKEIVQRSGHSWRTGSFTKHGLVVARMMWERRDKLPPPRKQRQQLRIWTPGKGAQTLYPSRVRSVRDRENPFRPGAAVAKLGTAVTKGRLKGAAIHYLTLEERATCPVACVMWASCYGNNMGLAIRWRVDAALMAGIERQMNNWNRADRRPRLVRLHELGDFPSVEYVQRWGAWLAKYRWLHVFGYTAWAPETDIGRAVKRVKAEHGRRFSIRWSGSAGVDGSVVFEHSPPAGTFACPEQQGRAPNCGACGACWSTDKAVAFKKH